jgi:hypothetical protein
MAARLIASIVVDPGRNFAAVFRSEEYVRAVKIEVRGVFDVDDVVRCVLYRMTP